MGLVPRLLGVGLVVSALSAGSAAALAGGTLPSDSNPGSVPLVLPPSVQDSLVHKDDGSGFAAQPQNSEVQNGRLDFFSVRPDVRGGDFTSLLGNNVGGGGLKFHLSW